jgi:hypothetical protein
MITEANIINSNGNFEAVINNKEVAIDFEAGEKGTDTAAVYIVDHVCNETSKSFFGPKALENAVAYANKNI